MIERVAEWAVEKGSLAVISAFLCWLLYKHLPCLIKALVEVGDRIKDVNNSLQSLNHVVRDFKDENQREHREILEAVQEASISFKGAYERLVRNND